MIGGKLAVGDLVAPKTEGRLEVIEKALKIYYSKKQKWVSNADYIVEMQKLPTMVKRATGKKSGNEDISWYTAVTQIPSYFCIIEHQTRNDKNRRLTPAGEKYYEALTGKNRREQKKVLFDLVEKTTFGRGNAGAPSSDCDYEIPRIAMKAIYDLGPITQTELVKLLHYTIVKNYGYDAVKNQLLNERAGAPKWTFGTYERKENRYVSDPKFLEFLVNNGLIKNLSKGKRSPKYIIPDEIKRLYSARIEAFELTNRFVMVSIEDIDAAESLEDSSYESATVLSAAELALRESKAPIPSSGGKTKRYITDPDILRTALENQKYICGCGGSVHFSFYRRDGKTPYVEGHHVIPMKAQKDYPEDALHRVDREANIVALCPTCHKMVHHGTETDVKSVLSKIYNSKRIAALSIFGIPDVDSLYNKYYKGK